ncbi:hypothetical protein GQ53DRAFT_101434 [Thozetella sp. PMI_491]|nr:hypothetical protein GQ53DRAFT_101434 [Thozetella sp. PMI_491]
MNCRVLKGLALVRPDFKSTLPYAFPKQKIKMSEMGFTFVNTTGSSAMSESAARRVRAHITKTNFANRRQRMAKARTGKPAAIVPPAAPGDIPLPAGPGDMHRDAQFLSRFWSLVFLYGGEYPISRDEAAWADLVASEPALFESSMAAGIRQWSPDPSCQRRAEAHACKATHLLIQHFRSGSVHTDAILGAVSSMAVGERTAGNDAAWFIHLDGLAQIMRERHAQGMPEIPGWLCDIFISDIPNHLIGFPRFYHRKVIDAMRLDDSHPLFKMQTISESFSRLQKSIDTYQRCEAKSDVAVSKIEESRGRLLQEAQNLRMDARPSVHAMSRTVEILLHLSWGVPARAKLDWLASELQKALCRGLSRPCCYMDLTSCQLMAGAIAATKGSDTRAWFLSKLGNAVQGLRQRGWDQPLEHVEKRFLSHGRLVVHFRALWEELLT